MAKKPTTENLQPKGYRKKAYKKHIDKCLRPFGPRQRARIMEPGWTKVKEYSHLLTRRNFEEWTAFALRYPFEVVQQAARRGRPSIARTPIKSIMFRLHKPLRDLFVLALEERGWIEEPGKPGGHKVSVERALEQLIVDAANWDALNAEAYKGDAHE